MPYNKFYVNTADVKDAQQMQRTFNTVQQNVDAAITGIEKSTILNGVQYDNVFISTQNTFYHKLGRKPNGYIIVRNTVNCNIWDSQMDENVILLNTSANTTISIYIY